MADSMVERVARAIYTARWFATGKTDSTWQECVQRAVMQGYAYAKQCAEECITDARAAIEAMREPTDAMTAGTTDAQ